MLSNLVINAKFIDTNNDKDIRDISNYYCFATYICSIFSCLRTLLLMYLLAYHKNCY
jgi:hypothetical protein